ncbi:hypothetical protein HMPREF9701_00391 [Delftia acidovorans CCUG 274B]|nr:hypothetical protein HMPREF9701_00391 [Delftia acidovorans CCUG 274B]
MRAISQLGNMIPRLNNGSHRYEKMITILNKLLQLFNYNIPLII